MTATAESLRAAVEAFAAAVDRGDAAAADLFYAPDFDCWRVPDEGAAIRIPRSVMLGAIAAAGKAYAPTRATMIDCVELFGDLGTVLLRRVKDLGGGWETMGYCLLWRFEQGRWRFVREYVHQRTLPAHTRMDRGRGARGSASI
jgi:ketosteroid isomerase-like protein